MDYVRLDLDPNVDPPDHLRALVAAVPGTWRIDGAEHTWRAEQVSGGLVRSVGLARTSEGWVLSWRVDADVDERIALAVIVAAVAAAVVVLAVANAAGFGALGLVGSAVALLVVIRGGRYAVRAGLPGTEVARAELAAALRAVVSV